TLARRYEAGEHIQEGGFTGARSTGNNDVKASADTGFQQVEHSFCNGKLAQEISRLQRIAAEAANGKKRTVYSQRRNDSVDARTVRQACIHHGRRFVDTTPDTR